MMPVESASGDVHMQCDGAQLLYHTQDGWRLVAVLETEGSPYEDSSRPLLGAPSEQREFAPVRKRPAYLLTRSVNEEIARLKEQTVELASLLSDTKEELRQVSQKLRAAESSLNAAHEREEASARAREDDARRARSLQESLRKREEDLAKVREAIGSKEWNRIVGDKP